MRFASGIRSVHLQAIPLAIAVIAVTTAMPTELTSEPHWHGGFHLFDFVQNLILYAPLGAALSRCRWRAVILTASLLSAGAELLQMWSYERYASPYDIVSNVLGAIIGAALWRRFGPRERANVIRATRLWIVGALLVSFVVIVIWMFPARSAALTGWNAQYALALGNETTGDRPWRGTINELAFFRGSLSPAEIVLLQAEGVSARELAPKVLFHSAQSKVFDGGPAERLPASTAKQLAQRIEAEGAFSIAVKLVPARARQKGPARIVTFSDGTRQRNFDLGQQQNRLTFRFRTPVTGVNGQRFRAETYGVVKANEEIFVVATYDGAFARIFVDGVLHAKSNLAAAKCLSRWLCGPGLSITWAFVGAAFAVAALALAPSGGSAARRATVSILGGFAALLALESTQVAAEWVFRPLWMRFTAALGIIAVAAAAYLAARDTPHPAQEQLPGGRSTR